MCIEPGWEVLMSRGPYPTLERQTGTRMTRAPEFEPVGIEATATAEPVIDSEEAARFLDINPKTLQKMARNGEVPGYRIGKFWRFRISDLDGWLRSRVISRCHSCRENERR